jgi:LDH2 family malate/lactate/ureidoglycolate dehydrogenase
MKRRQEPRKVPLAELSAFANSVFIAVGASKENAQAVTAHLVDASLRGVDSHGVVRIPVYVQGVLEGGINPAAAPVIVKETGTSALIDGQGGFGQVAASAATKMVAIKAKKNGLSVVGVRNLNHVGTLAYYGRVLAESGFIARAYTSGFPRAAPWGGRGKVFGTNPLCFAFPARDQNPIIVDIATTAVAAYKIMLAEKTGDSIPNDWAVDVDGSPTTNPKRALEGALLPMARHKGYGLALSVEIMSRVLVAGPPYALSRDVAYTQGGFFIEATSIDAFVSADEYYRGIDELVNRIRRSPLARGYDRIYLPGEPETLVRELRLKEGIPIEDSLWESFCRLAEKLSVRAPSSMD